MILRSVMDDNTTCLIRGWRESLSDDNAVNPDQKQGFSMGDRRVFIGLQEARVSGENDEGGIINYQL